MKNTEITIRDLATVFSGYAFSSTELVSSGIPVLKIGNVQRKFVTKNVDSYFDGEITKKLEKYILRKNDFLIAMTGAGSVGRVGKMFECNDVFLINQRIAIVRPKNDDKGFLYYWMTMPFVEKYLYSLGIGAGQPNISANDILNIKIDSPSISIQQKIASILSTYDFIIENNKKRIKLLEQMAENLYKEWFVRFRFPGHENVEMENGLPKGWKIERLGNVAKISTGKCNREDAEEDGMYPLFDRSQEIKKSSTWLKDCEAIIIPGEGTSFIPRYFKGKFNLHQRCYCVEPTTDNTGKYLFHMLMINRSYFLSVATGATVPSLRQNNFTKMRFVLPSMEIVQKYDKIASHCFKEIDSLKKQNTLLTRQRDLLLPRLMSGKLQVKP